MSTKKWPKKLLFFALTSEIVKPDFADYTDFVVEIVCLGTSTEKWMFGVGCC